MGMSVLFGSREDAELWKEKNSHHFTWVKVKEVNPHLFRATVPDSEYKKWATQQRQQRLLK